MLLRPRNYFLGVAAEVYGELGRIVPEWNGDAAKTMTDLIALRAELRQAKKYAEADALRKRLEAVGITIKDTPAGAVWEYNPT